MRTRRRLHSTKAPRGAGSRATCRQRLRRCSSAIAQVQLPPRAADELPFDRADCLHTWGGLGGGAGREPSTCQPLAVILHTSCPLRPHKTWPLIFDEAIIVNNL